MMAPEMTPEQRYFFDTAGYLHLRDVLSEDELKPAQEAAEGYIADFVPPGVHNVTARAGDVVIISERLIHGALSWKPQDRDRRFMIMRYNVQHMVTGGIEPFSEEIRARLSPETLELAELAPYTQIKEIVKERCGDIDTKNKF